MMIKLKSSSSHDEQLLFNEYIHATTITITPTTTSIGANKFQLTNGFQDTPVLHLHGKDLYELSSFSASLHTNTHIFYRLLYFINCRRLGNPSFDQRIYLCFVGTSDPVVQVQWAKMTDEGLKAKVGYDDDHDDGSDDEEEEDCGDNSDEFICHNSHPMIS